jgi:ABC-type nitrate/sulfonate/bicarbonate transport system substrate-binding protein
MNSTDFLIPRRKFLLGSTGIIAGAVGDNLLHSEPAIAQLKSTIPAVTVKLACHPYGDHAWIVLAGRKGFLKDVGITLDPPEPKVVLEEHSIPQLENGEIDATTMYLGNITAAIDRFPNIKPFFVYDRWEGNTILIAPDSGLKTVDEFITGGLKWEDASREAMAQLKGVDIVVPPEPATYPWMNLAYSFAGLKMEDSKVIALDDPKAVQLAISGSVKVAAPGGAVQIYQLEHQAGWKTLMSTGQMVKYVKGGVGSAINNVVNFNSLVANQRYIDDHHDTVLRLCSALYRTIDYMFGADQITALAEYAPFINANAGSELDASAIKFIFEVLDPFFTYKDQSRLWTDESYPLYYESIYKYQLDAYKKAGTIANKDYDLDDFFQAKKIWQEMSAQKSKADGLLGKIKVGGTLSEERQKFADAAKAHYNAYNFLDAVRFLEAAVA